ncbi:MAG: cysteine desulfurase-like protein, partial [Anaerolineae bacterium]|nr:cysteine desulfurase-like protein [Anaerolineae bacterium]
MTLDIASIRAQFPSLHQEIDGHIPIYFDNPAGTQVPQRVIDALVNYFTRMNANQGGAFATSHATDSVVDDARQIVADFINAPQAEQIVFGPNMTTLNFAFSRALAQTLPDDAEIVVTRMDHDANVAPWMAVARDRNLPLKWVDFDPETGTLDMNSLESAITEKTKVVATVHASNALGTINPVKKIADMAHNVGAIFVMDAVQSAPHVPLDVQQIGCDVLLCSAYKFFGPHIGIMYARYDLLADLPAYKVRPSKDKPPYRWETGTPSFETIAATAAALRYIESLASDRPVDGNYDGQTLRLKQAMLNLQDYEATLAKHLINGLEAIPT